MKFSICIPNYNYASYLGRTIQSVLDQDYGELEILISDNVSTDGSVELIRSFKDDRIRLHINACNVGFAGNLDKAAAMATGDLMIMLSSDDLMRPGALRVYRDFFASLGSEATTAVASSSADVVDRDDAVTGKVGPDLELWRERDRERERALSAPGVIYRIAADDLLRECLQRMRNPFNFLSTVYPRQLYERVEGYGGARAIAPDKWFNWRLLGAARTAYFLDAPLFAYRWHAANQTAQQSKTGALKHLVDDYLATLELDPALLGRLGLGRPDLERAFIEYDVARHGLATLARGERVRARRILLFGASVYPWAVRHNRKSWALRALLLLGPAGRAVATAAYRHRLDRDPVRD